MSGDDHSGADISGGDMSGDDQSGDMSGGHSGADISGGDIGVARVFRYESSGEALLGGPQSSYAAYPQRLYAVVLFVQTSRQVVGGAVGDAGDARVFR